MNWSIAAVVTTAHPDPVVEALLQVRDGLLAGGAESHTAARTVTEVLSRSPLAPLDLTAYLLERGFSGVRLAQAIGSFAPAVRDAFGQRYGRKPLKVIRDGRVVNSYLEVDRPLVDEVFRMWSK